MLDTDTIAALATANGKAGIGIVRVSGAKALEIGMAVCKTALPPRHAKFCSFHNHYDEAIDKGLAIFFQAPASFTGEDIVEFQAHGGPVILDMLMEAVLHHGARPAQPGEFSKRAFLNDKIDLAQAEAIADLIDASSRQAANSALRTLDGVFSKHVQTLADAIMQLRMYVESAIDFPEEEIDFLNDGVIANKLETLINQLHDLLDNAEQGKKLRDGIHIALAGSPNAGKSSLLNALAGSETAIVTDIAGTTRDVVRENILIDGIPVHISDTAGLRQANDEVERIGIERSLKEAARCDLLILVIDGNIGDIDTQAQQLLRHLTLLEQKPIIIVDNKCDLSGRAATQCDNHISLSAKTGDGIALLRNQIKQSAGIGDIGEGSILARRRHIDALQQSLKYLLIGQQQLVEYEAGELLAEDLSLAHRAIGEITGRVSSDELLGVIFSSFCIGK